MKNKRQVYIGMNKSPDRGSLCIMSKNVSATEIHIKERFTRVKSDGGVDLSRLTKNISKKFDIQTALIAESSYYKRPIVEEEKLNQEFPYFDRLLKLKQEKFSRKFNRNIEFLTHHYCHARAAAAVSPFFKSIIVVLDCSGNASAEFAKDRLAHSANPFDKKRSPHLPAPAHQRKE